MKRIILSLAVFLFAAAAWGQVGIPPGAVINNSAVVGGSCSTTAASQFNTLTQILFICPSGTLVAASGGGGGTSGVMVNATLYSGGDIGAQVNSAWASFGASPACGPVYIPPGTYTQTTTINPGARLGCTVQVIQATLNYTGTSSALLINNFAHVAFLLQGVGNSTINCTNSGSSDCISLTDAYFVKIDSMTISSSSSTANCVLFQGNGAGSNDDAESLWFTHNSVNICGSHGLAITGAGGTDSLHVANNQFSNATGYGLFIGVVLVSDEPPTGISVLDNLLKSNVTGGLLCDNCNSVQISGNSFEQNGGSTGSQITMTPVGNSNGVTITGNGFNVPIGNTSACINMPTTGGGNKNILISGNYWGAGSVACVTEIAVWKLTASRIEVLDASLVNVATPGDSNFILCDGFPASSSAQCTAWSFNNGSRANYAVNARAPWAGFQSGFQNSFAVELQPIDVSTGSISLLASSGGNFIGNTDYEFLVRCVNSAGEGGFVAQYMFPYAIHGNIGGSGTTNTLHITWTGRADCTSGYTVYGGLGSGGPDGMTLWGTYTAGTGTQSKVITAASSGTKLTRVPTKAFSSQMSAALLSTSDNTLASASTIAPLNMTEVVSGTTTISTITVPANFLSGCLTLIPTGAWATTTGGNIANVVTATVNVPVRACYSQTQSLWYMNGNTTTINGVTCSLGASCATNTTATNCAGVGTAASPSVVSCTAAAAGAFSCDPTATGATCTINTTAVTANSEIFVSPVLDEGTRLSVTCNTTPTAAPAIILATKTAATSFTINLPTFAVNPVCYNYSIIN